MLTAAGEWCQEGEDVNGPSWPNFPFESTQGFNAVEVLPASATSVRSLMAEDVPVERVNLLLQQMPLGSIVPSGRWNSGCEESISAGFKGTHARARVNSAVRVIGATECLLRIALYYHLSPPAELGVGDQPLGLFLPFSQHW